MTLLDTDTLTLLFRQHPALVRRIAETAALEGVSITIVTKIEALRGRFDSVFKAADAGQLLRAVAALRATEGFLTTYQVVEFDQAAAATFDELREVKGFKKIGRDLLIACIALANDALLVSRNLRDFRQVAGRELGRLSGVIMRAVANPRSVR